MSCKIDGASDLLKKGLQMSHGIHGHDYVHSKVAKAMSELGKLHYNQRKHEEAVKMYERGFEMKHATYGEESSHPDIATSLTNLGRVYQYQGKLRCRV